VTCGQLCFCVGGGVVVPEPELEDPEDPEPGDDGLLLGVEVPPPQPVNKKSDSEMNATKPGAIRREQCNAGWCAERSRTESMDEYLAG
jgi:hypothetical protein